MRIYGLDFTSAPTRRKPITCVAGEWRAARLRVTGLEELTDFAAFEAFLERPGPWIAGLDFPFGQPRQLIKNLGWPTDWAGYVGHLAAMDMRAWEAALKTYRDARPPGDRHHRRETDRLADARSPMMLYGVPVGRMFFQGAPRLLRAGVSVLPCHPTDSDRIAVEAYPALVARRWIGRRAYKSDDRRRQTPAHAAARRAVMRGLRSDEMRQHYGFSLAIDRALADEMIRDPRGDALDALLGAVQAAWAWAGRGHGYNIPADCNPDEGWIVDPATVR